MALDFDCRRDTKKSAKRELSPFADSWCNLLFIIYQVICAYACVKMRLLLCVWGYTNICNHQIIRHKNRRKANFSYGIFQDKRLVVNACYIWAVLTVHCY